MLPTSTKTNATYTVKCRVPIEGTQIQLTTTKNAYLQINKVTVTGSTTGSSSGSSDGPVLPPNSKIPFKHCAQSSNYNKQNSYPCENAFSNGPKFSHTAHGVG